MNQVYFYYQQRGNRPLTLKEGLNPFMNQVYFYQVWNAVKTRPEWVVLIPL